MTSIMFSILFLSLLAFSSACNPRYYDATSFVCVCDAENCDTLDEDHKILPGQVIIYESNALKYRLHKSQFDTESLLADGQDESGIHIKIDTNDRKQSIYGFGGAFTDSTGININKLPENLRHRLVKDYFDKDGVEYNMGRVPVAGSDFSDRPYSYDDVEGDFELKNFSLARDDFVYKIPYIKEAMVLNPEIKLFAAPWTSPTWLKTNNKSDGLGILIGEPGSLHWQTFANYIVKFLDAYAEKDIDFWGLSPVNEPLTGLVPGYKWNTLGFSPQMMGAFLKKDLGPALKAAGYGKDKLKLMIFDHNTDYVELFTRGVLSDPEAAAYVSGVAYHWYDGHYYENLDAVHRSYPDYFILSTEACEGWTRETRGVSMGNWTRAENYASDIIEGLNHWSNGWVDWNLVLDTNGGPNWADNVVDAPIIVNETAGEYYKQPMFYSLGHFSKYLPPGSVRVGHEVTQGNDNVKMTSFVTPHQELVLIVLNTNEEAVFLTINGLHEKPMRVTLGPRSLRTIISKI